MSVRLNRSCIALLLAHGWARLNRRFTAFHFISLAFVGIRFGCSFGFLCTLTRKVYAFQIPSKCTLTICGKVYAFHSFGHFRSLHKFMVDRRFVHFKYLQSAQCPFVQKFSGIGGFLRSHVITNRAWGWACLTFLH